jgi:hypothetical protein
MSDDPNHSQQEMMHTLQRIDHQLGLLCHWAIMAFAAAVGWYVADLVKPGLGSWPALAAFFLVFIVIGAIGERDIDFDLAVWRRKFRR